MMYNDIYLRQVLDWAYGVYPVDWNLEAIYHAWPVMGSYTLFAYIGKSNPVNIISVSQME